MFKYYSAMLFGATIGFISLLPLQAMNNSMSKIKCNASQDTHTLVTVRAFAGTANYCVGNQYLGSGRIASHYGPAH